MFFKRKENNERFHSTEPLHGTDLDPPAYSNVSFVHSFSFSLVRDGRMLARNKQEQPPEVC